MNEFFQQLLNQQTFFFFASSYFKFTIWQLFVYLTKKRKKNTLKQLLMLFLLIVFSFLEFCLFNQILRKTRYDKFSFFFSILIPLIIFYFCLYKVLRGVVRSLKKGPLRLRSAKLFCKYQKYFSGIFLSHAYAYSSVIGIVLSILSFIESYFMEKTFPKPKKVIKKNLKDV